VKKAKEAVALDVRDPTSWYILGNALLTRFFHGGETDPGGNAGSHRLPDLEAALRAYSQSEVVSGGASPNADLHYNRAVLLTFKEDYAAAIEGYGKAASIDVEWDLPRELQTKIQQYIEEIDSAVHQKGRCKPKKVPLLAKAASAVQYSQALSKITFSNLQEGRNSNQVLCVKVGSILSPPGAAPSSLICVDETEKVGPVSLYGINPQKGIQIGDSLCIPHPVGKKVELSINSKNIRYITVHVDYSQVEVNGSPYNKELYAAPSFSLTTDSKKSQNTNTTDEL